LFVADPPYGWVISAEREDTWQEDCLSLRIGGAMVVWVILAVVFIVLLFAYVRVRGRRLTR